LWGGLANLRPIGKSACLEDATATLTAALFGISQSWLQAGFQPALFSCAPAGFCRKRRSIVCRSC